MNDSLLFHILIHFLYQACIIPILKSGDSTDFKTYRPISILPLFNSFIGKCIYPRANGLENAYIHEQMVSKVNAI